MGRSPRSRRQLQRYDRKINLRSRHVIHIVRQRCRRNVGHDFEEITFRKTRLLESIECCDLDVTALLDQRLGKRRDRATPRITARSGACLIRLLGRQPGALADDRVCADAVLTVVGL